MLRRVRRYPTVGVQSSSWLRDPTRSADWSVPSGLAMQRVANAEAYVDDFLTEMKSQQQSASQY